ncbi:MAG TPA: recombinase family protein [Herpetosiphonaceae bacterium]
MRLALYVRVSTPRQAQNQGLDQQLVRLRAYAAEQQWSIAEADIFCDDGYSGATLARPALARLRDQIARATYTHLLLTAPDRLARNYVHQVLLLEEWTQAGCAVMFVERAMTHDPHDQLVLQIRGAVAEYERSLIAERMWRGRQAKLRAGVLLPWSRPPYGYLVDPDTPRDPRGVQLNPMTAPLVAEIFTRYTTEPGRLLGLAKALTQLDVPSPYGKARWNASTLHGILSNPVYTGVVYAGRMRTRAVSTRQSPTRPVPPPARSTRITPPSDWTLVAHIPAIVTQEVFDQVQAKLAQNQRWATRHNTAYEYLLRALVSCGVCQRACMGCARKHLRYYVCLGKGNPIVVARDTKCRSRYIPAAQLDTLVWQDLCTLLLQPEVIQEALYRAQAGDWLPQEVLARRPGLRNAHAHLSQQVERLTMAYLDQVIPLEEYRRRRHDIEQRQHSFDTQIRHLEAQAAQQANLAAISTSIEDFCRRVRMGVDQATFAQKRQLIELLVDRVVVTEEDVEIRYVIPTSPESEQIKFYQLRLDYFNVGLPGLPFINLLFPNS